MDNSATDARDPARPDQGSSGSGAFCRLLAENTRDVVLVCRPDLTVRWASPSLRPALGIDPRGVVGARPHFVDSEDLDVVAESLQVAITEHQDSLRTRLRLRTADGDLLWFDVSAALLWEADPDTGTVPCDVVVSMRDVTAEVAAQEALAVSEQRFRRSMADSAIGMALVAPDGRFLEVNRALCEFFSLDEDTLLSKTWQELTHPYDVQADQAAVQRLLDGQADRYRMTKRYVRSDGAVLVGDLSVSAIRADGGSVQYFVSQIVDMTEQTRVQQELAQSEEHFRLLADNASDVVVRASNDGVMQWVSQSVTSARGWRPEDLVGHPFLDFVHPDDVSTVQLVQQGVRGGQQGKLEARIRGKDGDHRWFSITVSPIRNSSGVMTGRVSSWRDVDSDVAARELAAAREAEFRLLAEHASDLVLRMGCDDRITWVSPSSISVLGWWPDDMLGRPSGDFLDPIDVPRSTEQVASLRPGEPVRSSGRVRCGDGSYRWFASIATRIVDDRGEDVGRIVGLRDIQGDMESLEPLITSEAGLAAAMQSSPAGMAVIGLDRRFLQVNDALVALVGHDRDWFLSHGISDLLPPEHDAADLAVREELRAGGPPAAVVERPIVLADGNPRWVLHSIGLVRNDDGRPTVYFSQFLDVDQARQARSDLEFLATHDVLTRLPNRRGLLARMEAELAQPVGDDTRLGVLFVDLDSLKSVNDRFGHLVGDTVLVEVGKRIVGAVREDDLVARIGGDEFVCLLSSVRDAGNLATIARKVQRAVAEPVTVGHRQVVVTTSVGATLAVPGDLAEDVIARADRALYEAKGLGGDRIHVHPAVSA